jgi:putative ABC transport system permease protein
VGKIAATFWEPPENILLEPGDAARAFVGVMVICVLASVVAIRAALRVEPAEAIGG